MCQWYCCLLTFLNLPRQVSNFPLSVIIRNQKQKNFVPAVQHLVLLLPFQQLDICNLSNCCVPSLIETGLATFLCHLLFVCSLMFSLDQVFGGLNNILSKNVQNFCPGRLLNLILIFTQLQYEGLEMGRHIKKNMDNVQSNDISFD